MKVKATRFPDGRVAVLVVREQIPTALVLPEGALRALARVFLGVVDNPGALEVELVGPDDAMLIYTWAKPSAESGR